jgi:dipeptidyl aminopeptidase/acylaminoacyl peptidase
MLGFFADGKLKRIDRSGANVRTLADARSPRGGSWGGAGQSFIVFAPTSDGPLEVVSGNGGFVERATTLNAGRAETSHRWPLFLPDGRHFVYLAESANGPSVLVTSTLGDARAIVITEADSGAAFARLRLPPASNQLLFVRKGRLTAQPFNELSDRPTGMPQQLDQEVLVDSSKYAFLSISDDVMAYAGTAARGPTTLSLVDRTGNIVHTIESQSDFLAQYADARLAPDMRRVAVSGMSAERQAVWLYDLRQRTRIRISPEDTSAVAPVWSPDGTEVAFASNSERHGAVVVTPARADGAAQSVLNSDTLEFLTMDWSRDGKALLILSMSTSASQISTLPRHGSATTRPVVRGPSNSLGVARFSPNGRWVSYVSTESNRPEVYVISVSGQSPAQRVSTDGGIRAVWSGSGRELFYLSSDEWIVAVNVREDGSGLHIGAKRPLFPMTVVRTGDSSFDVSRDGRQFLMIAAGATTPYTFFTTSLLSEAKRFGWLAPKP